MSDPTPDEIRRNVSASLLRACADSDVNDDDPITRAILHGAADRIEALEQRIELMERMADTLGLEQKETSDDD